jgi:hypothetical protein
MGQMFDINFDGERIWNNEACLVGCSRGKGRFLLKGVEVPKDKAELLYKNVDFTS